MIQSFSSSNGLVGNNYAGEPARDRSLVVSAADRLANLQGETAALIAGLESRLGVALSSAPPEKGANPATVRAVPQSELHDIFITACALEETHIANLEALLRRLTL